MHASCSFHRPILPLLLGAFLGLGFTACSTLGVRVSSRPEAQQSRQIQHLLAGATTPAAESLRAAQSPSLSPEARLALCLAAAQSAWPEALRGENESRRIYNVAVAQVVTFVQKRDFTNQILAQTEGIRRLEIVKTGSKIRNPLEADELIPAASVHITRLLSRTTQPGLGAPYVLNYHRNSPALVGQPGISRAGISSPATAVLTFTGSTAQLSFRDTLRENTFQLGQKRAPLAADFSAPIALLVSRAQNRSLDLRALLFTDKRLSNAGLAQFQPYDPHKIPVVFVHGLLARPEAWTQALNGLMADPEIRRRYQFWFLLYPTGLPVWKSAAILRAELDRFHQELERAPGQRDFKSAILIGHSMGGLISSLVIREGGKRLWGQFSDAQIEDLDLSPEAEKSLKEFIFFPPRHDISRVIFVATPHRGSRLAINPLAGLLARFIRLPEFFKLKDRKTLISAIREDARGLFMMPSNSIRFLQANSPLLTSIEKLPLSRPIPYHSIIGDRGRGNSPNSSDGVVPYWSSHLETAVSEKIVPSGHGANENAEAIEEMRRILIEAL